MIEIYCKARGQRSYVQIAHGPFPLTAEQWDEAVARYREQWDSASEESRLMDAWVTTAREILKEYGLSDFDMIMLGNPLAMFVAGNAKVFVESYNKG